jgi:hypothetical protein
MDDYYTQPTAFSDGDSQEEAPQEANSLPKVHSLLISASSSLDLAPGENWLRFALLASRVKSFCFGGEGPHLFCSSLLDGYGY